MTWGEQLAEARRARGFTQEELAERLGVSRQAVAKWERDAARPGPTNARALRDLLGEDFPAPPAPSPASPPSEPATPAADTPAAPPAKPKRPRRWLAAAGGLGLLFCLLSHFNYLLAAGLGVWLLGLTAAGVVFGAVSRTARGQGVQPVLALGVRAAGAVLAALAVSALFAWGVWVGRAQYRVTALEPLDPALLAACPALSASIGATLPPGVTDALVYGSPIPTDEGIAAQYLLVTRGLSGPPAVRPRPARHRFSLIWQPGGDDLQAYLLELHGKQDFALEQRIAGQEEPIGIVPVAPDSQTQTAWQTEITHLWK